MDNATPWPLYHRERVLAHILEEAGWVSGPVWTGMEKVKSLSVTGLRTPNRQTHIESLYRLRYPPPPQKNCIFHKVRVLLAVTVARMGDRRNTYRILDENIGWRKNAWPILQKANLHHNTRKKYFMVIGLLKRGFWFTVFWRLTKMLEVSILSSNAGSCMSEVWLTDWKIPGIV
jgi:hypothetical protein